MKKKSLAEAVSLPSAPVAAEHGGVIPLAALAAPRRTIPVELAGIMVHDRLRSDLDEAKVEVIAQSMDEIGLQAPVLLRPHRTRAADSPQEWGPETVGLFALVAGAHRVEAAKRLGWTRIEAMIVDGTPDETRLIEIDENLARAELTALERARFLTARKEIYERAHPEASRGGDRKSIQFKGKNQTANLAVWSEAAGTDQTRQAAAPSYAEDTRARTGISVRTIRRAVYIGDSLSEEMAAALSGTPLADRQTDLEQIIAMPELKRRKVIEYCRTSKPPPKTLSEVLRAIGKTASTSETAPELNALKRAWMKATPRTRKRFVQWLRAQDRGAPL